MEMKIADLRINKNRNKKGKLLPIKWKGLRMESRERETEAG